MRELAPAERPAGAFVATRSDALKTSGIDRDFVAHGGRRSGRSWISPEILLAHFGSLEALSRAPIGELMKIKGVGEAKAIELKAAFALAARLARSEAEARAISTAEDVARLLGEEMRLLDFESVRVVCR